MDLASLVRHRDVRRMLHPSATAGLTRRELLQRLTTVGIGVGAASTLISAFADGLPAFGATNDFKGQTLVVTSYGGTWQDFMQNEHIPPFEALTGAKVELAIGLAKDWFARMQVAGKTSAPYDIYAGNETYVAQLRLEGMFAPLPMDKVPNLNFVPKALRQPKDVGVLGLIGALGITYRSDKIPDPPKSWLDLAKYGNKTAIFTIGNSGEPQHVLKMAQILTGNYKNYDAAVQWIGKNLCAARQVDFSGTEQTMLTQGEAYAGLIDAPDWAFLKAQGLPVEWALPKEGYCGMFEQDMNVTATSKVKDLAYAFINYWLSPPVQQKWAEKFYWTPANSHTQVSGDLAKLIPVTQEQLNQIPRWDYIWLNTSGARDKMTDEWNHAVTGHC